MALIWEGSTCAICNGKLDRPYTATSGVVFAPPHHLYQYCDVPLHFDCLESWARRVEFSEGYFNIAFPSYGYARYHLIHRTSEWKLAIWQVRDEPYPRNATIFLRTWPFTLGTRWADWNPFVAGEYRDGLVGGALNAAEQVMQEVAEIAPDLNALSRLYAIARTMEQHGN